MYPRSHPSLSVLCRWHTIATAGEGDLWSYLVYQAEIAPETGRRHVQAYMETTKRLRLNQVKDFLEMPWLHIEQRRGSGAQAAKYCKKLESRADFKSEYPLSFEGGVINPGSGKTSEQAAAVAAVVAGADIESIPKEFPGAWVRNYKGLTSLAAALCPSRQPRSTILALCLWGASRAGKTWKAQAICEKLVQTGFIKNYVMLNNQEGWMDGIQGKEAIIFNDWPGDETGMPFATFNGLFDPFTFNVKVCCLQPPQCDLDSVNPLQIKGGFAKLGAKYLIFTSNKHPRDWYQEAKYNLNGETIAARFTVLDKDKKPGVPTGIIEMQQRQEFQNLLRAEDGSVKWPDGDAADLADF